MAKKTLGKDKLQWSKFFWKNWLADIELRSCSLEARGLWMDMLAIAHDGQPYGHVTMGGKPITMAQLSKLAGVTVNACTKLVEELREAGVFSETDDGSIYSRRMVRDMAASEAGKAAGLAGGNPDIVRGTVPKSDRARPYKKSDSQQKTLRIFQKTGGICYWCPTGLQLENFHVDHLTPICDGGTNDEENLVPSCSCCNLARARHGWRHHLDPRPGFGVGTTPTPTAKNSDSNPDSKPEEEERGRRRDSDIPDGISAASAAPPPPAPDPVDPIAEEKKRLYYEGVDIIRALMHSTDRAARTYMGKLLKEMNQDLPGVLAVLRDAKTDRPVDPAAWIKAAIKGRSSPGKSLLDQQHEDMARMLYPEKFTDAPFAGPTIDGEAGDHQPPHPQRSLIDHD